MNLSVLLMTYIEKATASSRYPLIGYPPRWSLSYSLFSSIRVSLAREANNHNIKTRQDSSIRAVLSNRSDVPTEAAIVSCVVHWAYEVVLD